eukprot:PhF_6_TR30827/c0_g1_i1/m.45379
MRECRRPFTIIGLTGHNSEECRQLVSVTTNTIARGLHIEVQKLIHQNHADTSVMWRELVEYLTSPQLTPGSFLIIYFAGITFPFDLVELVSLVNARKILFLLDSGVLPSKCALVLDSLPKYKDVFIVGLHPVPDCVTAPPTFSLQFTHVLTSLEGSVPTTFGAIYDAMSFFRYRVKEPMPFYLASTNLVIDLDPHTTHHPMTTFEPGVDDLTRTQQPRPPPQQISKAECQVRLLEQIRSFPGQRSVDYARILTIDKKVIESILWDMERKGKVLKKSFPVDPSREGDATAKRQADRWFPV